MTNSTNSQHGIKGNEQLQSILTKVKERYDLLNVDIVMANQVALDIENSDVHSLLTFLRGAGWRQLSILTCVDWIDDGELQLVYILMNWDLPVRLQVRTRIVRDDPKFLTITNIYPGAKYYERDVHEFFGVVFEGNDDALKQLFLEEWDDIPPLRKDFDSRAYSDRKYAKREYKKDFTQDAMETSNGKAGE